MLDRKDRAGALLLLKVEELLVTVEEVGVLRDGAGQVLGATLQVPLALDVEGDESKFQQLVTVPSHKFDQRVAAQNLALERHPHILVPVELGFELLFLFVGQLCFCEESQQRGQLREVQLGPVTGRLCIFPFVFLCLDVFLLFIFYHWWWFCLLSFFLLFAICFHVCLRHLGFRDLLIYRAKVIVKVRDQHRQNDKVASLLLHLPSEVCLRVVTSYGVVAGYGDIQ